MSFDTSWDVDKHRSDHESEEHWQFRRAFLIEHKNKYPEDRLVSLAQIFFNVEFLGCMYPQQTMDLIENLSKGLVEDFREKRKGKLQRTFVVASDAAIAKAKGILQNTTPNINNNQSHAKNIEITTPYHPEYILPGFILILGVSEDPIEILDRSCSLCNMAKPLIKFDNANRELNPPIIKADLYINNKLIASGSGSSQKAARKDVSKNAYDTLKNVCFTIEIKEEQEEKEMSINKINKVDNLKSTNNSTSSILTTNEIIENDQFQSKLSEDNIGNKLLKNMGWKEGVGLGKNNQGRLEPIEVVQLPKNMGLGNKKTPVGPSAKQKIMFALQREIKIHIMKFIDSPKKRLTFSTEFTKEERKLIHIICIKLDLKTKSYGQNENRHIVIFKKENAHEIFEELINNGLENDNYKLILPKN